MEKKLNELVTNLANEITKKQDEKFIEACNAWGVDITNKKEVKERCVVIDECTTKDFRIDGYLVMMFTDIGAMENMSIDYDAEYRVAKLNASFKCSEIATPEDYGIKNIECIVN